jgi:phosphoglycerate dehydrogenase-like enzyme
MTRLFLYEPSYRRIASRMPKLSDSDQLLLMYPDGSVWQGDHQVPAEEVRPEVGWTNSDLFQNPAGRAYFIALLKSPALKWVQSGAAGFDHPMFAQLVQKGARLTTNHSQAVGMAEYVMWGVLDHLQHGPERRVEQAAGRWTDIYYTEISGSRWLIVGFGAIGQAVARRARAFDAHITGIRRAPGAHDLADVIAPPGEIKALLPDSDVVVLSLPLTAETIGLVDADFLARMKPGAVFVNVGRGGLVDEAALLAALDRGTPAHAVLDVFQTEPLPSDSPFWRHPRVTATAHASPLGSGLIARGDAVFLDNLARYLAGQPLHSEVDPKEVLAAPRPA